jgi:hypothetical protein
MNRPHLFLTGIGNIFLKGDHPEVQARVHRYTSCPSL